MSAEQVNRNRVLIRRSLLCLTALVAVSSRVAAGDGLTPEGLERVARELVAIRVEPEELERLLRRLKSVKKALAELEPLLDSELEPLPTVALEEGE